MKKFLILLTCFFSAFVLQAQNNYPTPAQKLGSSNAAVRAAGGFFIDSTLVIPHYSDTFEANRQRVSLYSSVIQVGDNNDYYKRVGNHWVLISGGCPTGIVNGSATWSSIGLTYNVTDCQYYINCVFYSSAATSLTLNDADPSYPRIDVIYVDIFGNAGIITGVPSAAPSKPNVNPLTQLELTYVYVPAASTIPGGETATIIYDENVEWAGSCDVVATNFEYTTNPYTGIYSTYIPGITSGQDLNYTDTAVHNSSDYQYLKFWVRLNNSPTADQPINFDVYFFNGGVRVSPAYSVGDGLYGFSVDSINTWQLVTIPIPSSPSFSFDAVQLNFYAMPSTFQVDRVYLLSGAVTPVTGSYWSLNLNAGVTAAQGLGTSDSTDLVIKTNNQARLIVSAEGIQEDGSNSVKMLMWNPTNQKLYWQSKDSIGVLGCLKLYDSIGIKWLRDTCSGTATTAWLLTGNSGTTAGTNFIGTTDNVDVVFKRNNSEAGRIRNAATSFGNGANAGTGGTSFGALAGFGATAIQDFTFLGSSAGGSSTGLQNVYIGSGAGYQSTSDSSVFVGAYPAAGGSAISGRSLTFVGYKAGQGNTGNSCLALGRRAAYFNTYNSIIALGTNATPDAPYQFIASDSITHMKFRSLILQNIDTINRKPLTWNPSTGAIYPSYWPSTGGGSTTDSASFHHLVSVNDSTAAFTRPDGTADTLVISGIAPAYKKWKGTVYINGSTIDSVKVRENTLGTVTWTYSGTGSYRATTSSLFTTGKVVVDIMSGSGQGFTITRNLLSASAVEFITFDGSIGFLNDYTGEIDLEIQVYN